MNFPNFIPQERKPFFGKLLAVISRWNLVKIKEKRLGNRAVQVPLPSRKEWLGGDGGSGTRLKMVKSQPTLREKI